MFLFQMNTNPKTKQQNWGVLVQWNEHLWVCGTHAWLSTSFEVCHYPTVYMYCQRTHGSIMREC